VFRKQLAFLQVIEDDTRKRQEDRLHVWMGFEQTEKTNTKKNKENKMRRYWVIYSKSSTSHVKVFFPFFFNNNDKFVWGKNLMEIEQMLQEDLF
jgi:hypothetical protein